jgi:hypothetical protein
MPYLDVWFSCMLWNIAIKLMFWSAFAILFTYVGRPYRYVFYFSMTSCQRYSKPSQSFYNIAGHLPAHTLHVQFLDMCLVIPGKPKDLRNMQFSSELSFPVNWVFLWIELSWLASVLTCWIDVTTLLPVFKRSCRHDVWWVMSVLLCLPIKTQ